MGIGAGAIEGAAVGGRETLGGGGSSEVGAIEGAAVGGVATVERSSPSEPMQAIEGAPGSYGGGITNPSGTAQTGAVGAAINRGDISQASINAALQRDINRSLGYDDANIEGPFATPLQVFSGFAAALRGPLAILETAFRGLFGGGGSVGPDAIDARELAANAGRTEGGDVFGGLTNAATGTVDPFVYAGGGRDFTGSVIPISAAPSYPRGGSGGFGGAGGTSAPSQYGGTGASAMTTHPYLLIGLLLAVSLVGILYYANKRGWIHLGT